jgi:hypothetical protein
MPARTDHDKFMIVLKVAAFVVVAGLVGGFFLLSGNDDGNEAGSTGDPAVPTIAGRAEPEPETTPIERTGIVPPVKGTGTAEITRAKPKPPPRIRPRRDDSRFAVIGRPCAEPGEYGLTRRFDPAVCRPDPRSDRPTWQRLF